MVVAGLVRGGLRTSRGMGKGERERGGDGGLLDVIFLLLLLFVLKGFKMRENKFFLSMLIL